MYKHEIWSPQGEKENIPNWHGYTTKISFVDSIALQLSMQLITKQVIEYFPHIHVQFMNHP